jgi:Ca2+-binding EF-hand superfamily protein
MVQCLAQCCLTKVPGIRVQQALRPKLTDEQKEQLTECFGLMDNDGSGAIDAVELQAAFKLLGSYDKMLC